jgi:hypothetical protein
MPIPEYTRRAYKNWYERNKDNEDFKDRRAIANKKSYQKRKLRQLEETKKLVVIKEGHDVSSNISLVNDSNLTLDNNSNIVINQSNIDVGINESNISLVNDSNIDINYSNITLDDNLDIVINVEKLERRFKKEVENFLNPEEINNNEYDIIKQEYYKDSIVPKQVNKNYSIYFDRPKKIINTKININTNNSRLRPTKKNISNKYIF